MSWRELQAGAPEIATAARHRFEEARVAYLGTLRPDGWPRISPIEPYFLAGELVLGAMASPKLEDLRRDSRCLLHSAVSGSSGADPEVKLRCRARETRDSSLLAAAGTWWAQRPSGSVAVFVLDVEEAVLVAWDTDFERMRSTRWTRGGRPQERERAYP